MNLYETSVEHPIVEATAWRPSSPAQRIDDHVVVSRGNSACYAVPSAEGDLIINTGHAHQGLRHRERFERLLGRPLMVTGIVLTQSHSDHIGGWSAFADSSARTIAHERLPVTLAERSRIAPHLRRRVTANLFARRELEDEPALCAEQSIPWSVGHVNTTTFVQDRESFDIGGRCVEVISVPGGESLDGLAVWLPEERTVWIGNLMGALWGALPHLSTIRGDRPRSAMLFIESVQRVVDLEPELLLTGHDSALRGAERIQREVGKVVEAVRYIYDATIEGMNQGKDLATLMADVSLPERLLPARGRGPVSWYVRAVWEEQVGWFHGESVTELYPVPQRAIWQDLAELAGGRDVLAARANVHACAGRPLEALHLTDIVLGLDPDHRGALEATLAALNQLYRSSDGGSYDDARLLELEIGRVSSLLRTRC